MAHRALLDYGIPPIEHKELSFFSVVFTGNDCLPVDSLNYSDHNIELKCDTVIGLLQNVISSGMKNTSDSSNIKVEVRTLYVDDFPECFPAVDSPHFDNICNTLPCHIQDLFRRSSVYISLYQSVKLANLLTTFAVTFSTGDTDLGHYTGVLHRIRLHKEGSIKQGLRRTPIHFRGEEEEHLEKMLKAGIIVESESDWASPVTLVCKRDGGVRWCVDYRK